MSETGIVSRIEDAQEYFTDFVSKPEWDDLTEEFGEPQLPAVDAMHAEERYVQATARHAEILDFTNRRLNFRQMHAKSGERWTLNYQDGQWGSSERTGLDGIDDPDSPVSQRIRKIQEGLGLIIPKTFAPDFEPDFILVPAAAGTTVGQRMQTQFGYRITPLGSDKRLELERIEDTATHPALSNPDILRVTTASDRPVSKDIDEAWQISRFAPSATNEFEITVGAMSVLLGQQAETQELALDDPGYETKNRQDTGRLVIHTLDGAVKGVNVLAPTPSDAERGRAQTLHSYIAMAQGLRQLAASGLIDQKVVAEGAKVGVVTNAAYEFQTIAAINAAIEPGFTIQMATYGPEATGIPRLIEQQQLSLLPEIHSVAVHLGFLARHIGKLSANHIAKSQLSV